MVIFELNPCEKSVESISFWVADGTTFTLIILAEGEGVAFSKKARGQR